MKNNTLLILFIFCISQSFGQVWEERKKVIASDREMNANFGTSVALDGDYAIVGADVEKRDALGLNRISSAGASYIFKKDNMGNWYEAQKLVASDRKGRSRFGSSVSIDGNYAIIGAPIESYNNVGTDSIDRAGAAYIFEKDSNGIWAEVKKVIATDRGAIEFFGRKVAISGNYALVGCAFDNEDHLGQSPLNNAGSAYLFERNANGDWNLIQKLTAMDRGAEDQFGWAVAISGNYAVIGAVKDAGDPNGGPAITNAGSAYLFERDSLGNWNQVQKIVATDRGIDDFFGSAVSIQDNIAVVGAIQDDENELGQDSILDAGSAFIFERDSTGNWNHLQKVVAPDRPFFSDFGETVSLSKNTLLVTATSDYFDSNGTNFIEQAGSAYIYKKDSSRIWRFSQKLSASDRDTQDHFGWAGAVSDNYAFISTPREDHDFSGGNYLPGSGSLYIFGSCTETTSTIFPSVCNFYSSPSANYIWNASGTYLDTVSSAFGCDSVITIHLTITEIDTFITQDFRRLTANDSNATSFQWLDCNNNYTPIVDATDRSFEPLVNGNYALEITKNSCIDTSACYSFMSVGIFSPEFSTQIRVYPNPGRGKFMVNLKNHYAKLVVKIRGINGHTVLEEVFLNKDQFTLNIDAPSGLYFLEVITEDGQMGSLKLILE